MRKRLYIILLTIITIITSISLSSNTTEASNSNNLMKVVKRMSLRDRIAQMYFVPSNSDSAQMEKDIQQYHFGGILLFGSDFQNETQQTFKDKINQFQKVSSIPLFIGTDQEGGTVSRLSDNPQLTNNRQFPSPLNLNQNLKQETTEATETAKILKNLGINWNFAPVADVSTDPNSFIYNRTYGKNYTETAKYISKVVPAIQKEKVVATLKHFPGYGNANDTHTGFATSDKSLSDLKKQDLLPFKAGIKAKVDAILISHILISQIDNQLPASLSPKVNRFLRKNLHYSGIIITDDLGMDAITKFAQEKQINADVTAVKAGNDMLISKNYASGIPAIEKAVQNHEISEKQINRSVYRILKLKQKLGIYHIHK